MVQTFKEFLQGQTTGDIVSSGNSPTKPKSFKEFIKDNPTIPASDIKTEPQKTHAIPITDILGMKKSDPLESITKNPNKVDKITPAIKDYLQKSSEKVVPFGETVVNALEHPIDSLEKLGNKGLTITTDALDKAGEGFGGAFVDKGTANKVADVARGIAGTAEAFFSPVTGLFNVASEIPGLKQVADVVNLPFTASGFAGSWATGEAVDAFQKKFPEILSKDSAEIIKQPLQEIGSIAGQVLLGGKIMNKISDFAKDGKELTPDIMQKIVDDAKSEAKLVQPSLFENTKGKVKLDSNINIPTFSEWKKAGEPTKPNEILQTPPEISKSNPIISNDTSSVTPDSISTNLKSLAEEAKKYKSAEEFVKAQGKPLYHGSSKADIIRREGFKLPTSMAEQTDVPVYGDGVYFSSKKSGAYDNTHSKVKTIEGYIPKDMKLYPATEKDMFSLNTKALKQKGFDGVEVSFPSGEKHFTIFDPSKIQTREQLINVYDKVHGTVTDNTPMVLRPLKNTALSAKSATDFISKANLNGNIAQALGERYKGSGIEELLTDFYNKIIKEKPTEIIQKTNKVDKGIETKITEPQKPIETNNKEFNSRVFERLKAEHPELQGELKANGIRLKEDIERATDLISSDKQKAFNVAMGTEVLPDITSTSVNIALAEKALTDGNIDLYSRLVRNRSLEQTRRGQEIVAEKGSVTDNSTSRYVKELISSRLESLGNEYLNGLKLKKVSDKTRGINKIESEVNKISSKIKSKNLDVKTALSLLDKLACV